MSVEAPALVDLPITEPIHHDPDATAENTFLRPDVLAMADERSPQAYTQYAVERAYGRDSNVARQHRKHGSRHIPYWQRDGWLVSPRWALAGTVVLTALANTGLIDGVKIDNKPVGRILPDFAGQLLGDARDAVDEALAPSTPIIDQAETIPGKPATPAINIRSETYNVSAYGSEQPSGKVRIRQADLERIDARLKEAKDSGDQLESARVQGRASDDWLERGQRSFGVPDRGNFLQALKRAKAGVKGLKGIFKRNHEEDAPIKIDAQEKVLTDGTDIGNVLIGVNKYGYDSITSAFLAYKRGDKMPSSLRNSIHNIAKDRSTVITLNFRTEEKTIPATPAEKPVEIKNDNKDKGPVKLPFGFLPFIPIPRFRRLKRDLFATSPKVKDEVPAEIEFELFKEASKGLGRELVGDSWAQTRKYLLLMRDDRIKKLSRYDYADSDGNIRSLRVGFVDHEPTVETLDAIEDVMKKISFLRGGNVADRLNMVMVFPTENTGRQHPKKIGLGIDEQMNTNVQGLAIPALNLVELHMPTNPTNEQLKGFGGMSWTMAHEIGGHFTDVIEKPTRLIRNQGGGRLKRNFRTTGVWANAGDDGYSMAAKRGAVTVAGRQFAIKAPADGPTPPTGELIVSAEDRRLRAAAFVRLHGMNPTPYGDSNAAESYAETAAQAITGIPVPFEEAGVSVEGAAVEGYHVDSGLLHGFTTRVGSLRNVDNLAWRAKDMARIEASWKRYDLSPNQDPQFNRNSEHAKNVRYQGPKKRLRIVSGAKS